MKPNLNPNQFCLLRAKTGLTQAQFAQECFCSTSTIQAIELGKLKPSLNLHTRMLHASGSKNVRAIIEERVEAYRNKLMLEAGML